MKTSFALLAAASLAAVASPAAAQDQANTFTGPWIGAIGGYDTSRAGDTTDNDVNEDDDQSIDGFGFGAQIGYDVDLGGVVVGAEAEWADSTAKVEINDGDFEGFGLGSVETGRDLYFGARVGAKVGPDAMIYVKGGYTNAKYNITTSANGTPFESDFDTDGYRIGAGAEYALAGNAFVKLEYRYSNYSAGEVDFEGENLPDSDRFEIDLDRHQVMAGIGIRF